jgi:hypothetical protein
MKFPNSVVEDSSLLGGCSVSAGEQLLTLESTMIPQHNGNYLPVEIANTPENLIFQYPILIMASEIVVLLILVWKDYGELKLPEQQVLPMWKLNTSVTQPTFTEPLLLDYTLNTCLLSSPVSSNSEAHSGVGNSYHTDTSRPSAV